jgi:hypothetical protein
MQPHCITDEFPQTGEATNQAAPQRARLSDELQAHRFATVLAPISAKSTTPVLPSNPTASPHLRFGAAVPNRILSSCSSVNGASLPQSENAANETGVLAGRSEKDASSTTPATTLARNKEGLLTKLPPLVALPVPSSPPLSPAVAAAFLQLSQATATTEATATTSSPAPASELDYQLAPSASRVLSTSGDKQAGAPNLQDGGSQSSRRITFVIDGHSFGGGNAPPAVPVVASAPLMSRYRNVLARRGDPVLHSEMGMYHLEYLDEGGKLQQRLTSFFHYYGEELIPADDETELISTDHLGPYLRESRQFREYVVDDIDRSCGVVNTAVTLSAREEPQAHPMGSEATDNGTDSVTLTGTVVNAVKNDVAPVSSELRESYQPLQGAALESALRKAWEWKQKSSADASHALNVATANGCSTSLLRQRSRLLYNLSPTVTPTLLGEASLAAYAGRDDVDHQNSSIDPKANTRAPSSASCLGVIQANGGAAGLSDSILPTFKTEVRAALQLGSINNPRAPLTPLQLAACQKCGAELIARKVLWTSFLAERYEMSVAFAGLFSVSDDVCTVCPPKGMFDTMLTHIDAAVHSYFTVALEEYLPWMADLYLDAYKPVPSNVTKIDNTAFKRKFRSVVRVSSGPPTAAAAAADAHSSRDLVPFAVALPGVAPADAPQMPTVASFLRSKYSSNPLPPPMSVSENVQSVVFSMSFLVEFSFVVLEELAIVARMLAPDVVANTINLLKPGAASPARDSPFAGLAHSVSLAVVTDSTTTGTIAHGLEVRSAGMPVEGRAAAAVVTAAGVPAAAAAMGSTAPAHATGETPAVSSQAKLANASGVPQQPHNTKLLSASNEPQLALSVVLPGGTRASSETMLAVVAPARKTARRPSSYERSRMWLKILFRFFRDEEAYNFLNDSPIAMRNFVPLPYVSYERILLRSRTVMAWTEFHRSVAASTVSLWGFLDKMGDRRRKREGKQPWGEQQWSRALRHCEQEALNLAAAMHELWFQTRKWLLQFVGNIFRATIPTSVSAAAGRNGAGGKRGCRAPCSPPAMALGLTPRPPSSLPSRSPAARPMRPMDPTMTSRLPTTNLTTKGDADAGPTHLGTHTTSRHNLAHSPQEHNSSLGSPPSVMSSEMVWGSNGTNPSRPSGDLLGPSSAALQLGGAARQRASCGGLPQDLQGCSCTSFYSSGFSLSAPSIMSSVSQPNPIDKEKRALCKRNETFARSTFATTVAGGSLVPPSYGERLSSSPDTWHPPSGAFCLCAHNGTYGDATADLVENTSRLLVPAMATTIDCLYKGHASDWDTVLLVRCQSLTRAVLVEQESFERQLLECGQRRCTVGLGVCEAMDEFMKAQEDVWLAHRRHVAKHLWDQVCMEKHMHICRWLQEKAQLDVFLSAVLTTESLAELQLEVLMRLQEDFQLLVREVRGRVPTLSSSQLAHPQDVQQLPQGKLTMATLALGPNNSSTTLNEAVAAARRSLIEGKGDSELPQMVDKAHRSTNKPFHFWGYGAFLPPAESAVGFNDGLVVMSRMCRDMHIRGRRLRTHWFVDEDEEQRGEESTAANFHDIEYANHDRYTGFTLLQLSNASVEEQEEMDFEPDEAHTPRERMDSMTDIHREGEDGAGQLLRHGLGNYTSAALGYTYVGGWYMDRPHGDGGLLYNGVFPWEARSGTIKKSLLLLFGRWEHGRLAHIEVVFSGVPLA